MKPLTREWIRRAEEDYQVTKREHGARPAVHNAVCFHAQQCVEKFLKALLQEHGIPFYRTHDLEALLDLCLPLAPTVEQFRRDLQWLTVFAVEARYPGFAANKRDAEQSFQIAKQVRTLLRRLLGLTKKRGQ